MAGAREVEVHLLPALIPAGRLAGSLAVVIDVFSRKVVGWSMATHLKTELVVTALDVAVAERQTRAWCITPTTARNTPR